jgi:hypothetical protein
MNSRHTRRGALALGVGLAGALAGCLGGSSGSPESSESSTSSPAPSTTADSAVGPPAADRSPYVPYEASRLRSATVSGGVTKDGIPSVDEPSFLDASVAALDDGEIVFGVVRGDDVRAYPQRILVHHEIVNDRLDGVPVSVTYCPLTGTVLGFERGPTTFGVSGTLVNSNLVMYDRATDSRWPQVLGTAIEGPLAGRALREFEVVWTTWGRWRRRHPDTEVLSEDTGYARNYGIDPYGSYTPTVRGYYNRESTMFDPLATDDRLGTKAVVVGVRTAAGATAVSMERLRARGVVGARVGEDRLAFVYDAALDAGHAYRIPADATIESAADAVRVDGERYSPDALPFERRHAVEAMWFAWVGFYPETTLHA